MYFKSLDGAEQRRAEERREWVGRTVNESIYIPSLTLSLVEVSFGGWPGKAARRKSWSFGRSLVAFGYLEELLITALSFGCVCLRRKRVLKLGRKLSALPTNLNRPKLPRTETEIVWSMCRKRSFLVAVG